jgi:hypothetical protein
MSKPLLVFYAPDMKVAPFVSDEVSERLYYLKLGESKKIGTYTYTVCKSSDIPDSRNKVGRMGIGAKCILIHADADDEKKLLLN